MIAPRISSTLPAWFSAQPMILKARSVVRQRVRQGSALADVQDGRHHSTAPREDAHRREQPATTTSLKPALKKVSDHTRVKQALLK